MDAVRLAHQSASDTALPPQGVNKWESLRELSVGRMQFGLSDRDMTVLQALVSFYPATVLGGNQTDLVVHPSNVAICERLNGMPGSTMRRHLSHLVDAGVILRRDSPNGKRYARRYGEEKIAFGFDLAPLAYRFAEFCAAAEAIRAAEDGYKRLRETVSLMRRDLAGLADFGASARPDLALWDSLSDLARLVARDLRRKLTIDDLQQAEQALSGALDRARAILEPSETTDMSTNESLSEQHYQNSISDSYDLEPSIENGGAEPAHPDEQPPALSSDGVSDPLTDDRKLPNIPLGLVLAACTEILGYAEGPIRHWHQLVRAADTVRPMMGISPSAWDDAKLAMGPEEAAVVVAAMLENFASIRSAGGYLRSLTDKAATGAFSCGPMVMALMRKTAA